MEENKCEHIGVIILQEVEEKFDTKYKDYTWIACVDCPKVTIDKIRGPENNTYVPSGHYVMHTYRGETKPKQIYLNLESVLK